MHQAEAGVAADDDLIGSDPHVLGKQGLGLGDTVEPAVIAAVGPVRGPDVLGAQAVDQASGQVQLLGAGLAAGHVQSDLPIPEFLVALQKFLPASGYLLGINAGQWFHAVAILSTFTE